MTSVPQVPEVRVVSDDPGPIVVELGGEHDMASAPELAVTLEQALEADRGLVIDISQAAFIDSSVLRLLFNAEDASRQQGRRLAVQLHTASVVRRAMQAVAFPESCVRPTRKEALRLAAEVGGQPHDSD